MRFLQQIFWTSVLSLFRSEEARLPVAAFTINLTHGLADPIGTGSTPALLINDSLPGPTLHLQHKQQVDFTVINNLNESTTIHFHGISQKDTPWSDGVPGVTQLPIRPGEVYSYEWNADEPGVYFYHAHSKGQIQDGVYGAIVVEAGMNFRRPFHLIGSDKEDVVAMLAAEKNLKPLLISDWTQFPYAQVLRMQDESDIDWNCFDAIIVNGVGAQYCTTRQQLDEWTSPYLKHLLADEGFPQGLTKKGCVPPIRPFQGDFRLNTSALLPTVYDICIGGSGSEANYSVNVRSRDRWAALTFINPGGLYPLKVTIDNHEMWVYAIDGRYIFPVLVDQVVVTNGARLSVLVRLDQPPGRYMIRISTALTGQILGGFGNLDYNNVTQVASESLPAMDYAGRPLRHLRIWNDTMTKPFPPLRPARTANRTFKLFLHKLGRPQGAWEWTLSGSQSYKMSEENRSPPLLSLPAEDLPNSPLFLRTNRNEWIDLIIEIQSITLSPYHPQSMPHPMHKHGSKAFILGTGFGHFPWESLEDAPRELFNFEDPPYRDSFYTPSDPKENTWIVLRYRVEQVGAWLMHCHVQTHLSGGMAVVLLDGVDEWPVGRKELGKGGIWGIILGVFEYVVDMILL